jgi:hypothetical protein
MVNEDLLQSETSRATGFIGQPSEIQWIRKLHHDTEYKAIDGPFGPPGEGYG